MPTKATSRETPFRILAFSKTTGYRHDCIPTAVSALRALGSRTGLFIVDATEDAEAAITSDSLAQYATVVFLHCTGTFLTEEQISALKGHVQGGGGFVGVHAAASGLKEDEWYGKLVGTHFDFHPPPEEGCCVVEDPGHFIMKSAGDTPQIDNDKKKRWVDEWYNFTSHPRGNDNLHILVRGDPSSFQGGVMGDDHPLVWCQEFDGGRSFYTALGHFDDAYNNDWYMDQLLKAILWTAGAEETSMTVSSV
ncbi:hypothetical protein CCHL11_10045 [Colletotrichum chlorophyti]|uniref:ThuA-like domain-containing protein n=1 Tax=Colletotrichum chlorophyti TaxID=708187 RepID=A0A1Q8RWZ4_9PEZI|nr:hypothetical protein CCHL11_10045 [Colletotrichum chlorophyti]